MEEADTRDDVDDEEGNNGNEASFCRYGTDSGTATICAMGSPHPSDDWSITRL